MNSAVTPPTILVTGGAGFIGSSLVDSLLRMNYRVRVFDNLDSGYVQYLDFVHPNLEFIHGDVLDKESVYASMINVSGVFHLAASSKTGNFPQEATLNVQVNAVGTTNVLEAAVASTTVKRFVYVGSSAYYGDDQDTFPGDPFSASSSQATSKFMGELITANYDKLFNLPTISVRFFGVFGPRQPVHGAYAPVRFLHNPSLLPNFLHVNEVVNGLLKTYNSTIRGTAIFLGKHEQVSPEHLSRMINSYNPSSIDSFETRGQFTRSFSEGEFQHTASSWNLFAEDLSQKFPGWVEMTPEAQSAVIAAYIRDETTFSDI